MLIRSCVCAKLRLWRTLFCNDTATTAIYSHLHTLSRHDALPISARCIGWWSRQTERRGIFMAENVIAVTVLFSVKPEFSETFCGNLAMFVEDTASVPGFRDIEIVRSNDAPHQVMIFERSEEHTSELQSLMRISYAVFCLKKKNQ